jgi:O-antigen/teichoic acid export membrane protein
MLNHILRYAPSQIVPALLSLLTVAIFTRVLSVEHYGYVALATAVMNAGQNFFSQWLCAAIMRLYAACPDETATKRLLASCGAWYVITICITVVGGVAVLLYGWEPSIQRLVLFLTIPQFVLFSLQLLTLRSHMAALESKKYSLLATLQAILSALFAIGFLYLIAPTPQGIIIGQMGGYALLLLTDRKNVQKFLALSNASRTTMREIWHYSWAIAIASILSFSISKGSRFILQDLLGSEAVGLYSAAYSLAEQAILSVFMIIVMASHPLAVRTVEQESPERVKAQLENNALWIFGLGLPAAVGFGMLAPEMATLFLGKNFRAEAIHIIPWVAFSTFLFGVKAHYIDHSFQLAKKNSIVLYVLVPVAIFNIGANYALIPLYGLMGAVYAGLCAYIFSIIITFWAARRVFPLPLPVFGIAKIMLATAIMAWGLHFIHIASVTLSLGVKFLVGSGLYGTSAIALNILGVRDGLRQRKIF